MPCLNRDLLKIIAATAMLIDHIGYILFPGKALFRIIGRIAFPIFAFFISEGCEYTKNKKRYFFSIFLLGALCQLPYYVIEKNLYLNILITFSFSVLVIYLLQYFFSAGDDKRKRLLAVIYIALVLTGIYILDVFAEIDYGFLGCMLPPFVFLGSKLSDKYGKVKMFFVALLLVSFKEGGLQWFSFLSLPLIFMYSGRKGKFGLKYFFYLFYPIHLAVLYLIESVIKNQVN